MGATYLSLQVRSDDRERLAAALEEGVGSNPQAGLQFYLSEPINGWTAVYPFFSMELEKFAKVLSGQLDCLILLLLSFDEDDFYVEFFRGGKNLGFFKIGAGSKRYGKARDKLAAKLEHLSEMADPQARQELLALLCDTKDVIFASDLLRNFAKILGIENALTSFDYLDRGERQDLTVPCRLQRIPGA